VGHGTGRARHARAQEIERNAATVAHRARAMPKVPGTSSLRARTPATADGGRSRKKEPGADHQPRATLVNLEARRANTKSNGRVTKMRRLKKEPIRHAAQTLFRLDRILLLPSFVFYHSPGTRLGDGALDRGDWASKGRRVRLNIADIGTGWDDATEAPLSPQITELQFHGFPGSKRRRRYRACRHIS
jgi:hypothetical protein